jgi:hypothetical protein
MPRFFFIINPDQICTFSLAYVSVGLGLCGVLIPGT